MKKGFTILEMIIVLSVIALIFLITLPNIQQKQKIIQKKGCNALVEVVNGQILLFELETLEKPGGIDDLIQGGYLKESQRRCPNGDNIEIIDGEASVQ
ncbi:MAG: competence type IV pilus major pilin ComGC [Erysipelotrichaceae bacterium]